MVWTQALAQNLEDKPAFLAELKRVLRVGGRLAMFEVLSGPGGPLHFPVPWGDGPDESFLVSSVELRRMVKDAGFTATIWNAGTDALVNIAGAVANMPDPGSDRGIGLQLLMPDFDQRMAGLARNVAEQRIELVQAVMVA